MGCDQTSYSSNNSDGQYQKLPIPEFMKQFDQVDGVIFLVKRSPGLSWNRID
jgi:hypothetical protein